MDLYAPVQTQHGELDIQAQADTGIEAQLFVETVEMENRSGRRSGMPVCEPNVTHIDECRTVENTPNREAQFEIRLQLHIAQL